MHKYDLEQIFNYLPDPDRELYELIKKKLPNQIDLVINNNFASNFYHLLEPYFYFISEKTYQKPENIVLRENQDKFFLYDDEVYELIINERVLYLAGFELLKHTYFYCNNSFLKIKIRVLSKYGKIRSVHESVNHIFETEALCFKLIDELSKNIELENKQNILSFICERKKMWPSLNFQYFGCSNVLQFVYFIENYMYVFSNHAIIKQRELYTQGYLQRVKNYIFCIEKRMPVFLEGRPFRKSYKNLFGVFEKFIEQIVFDLHLD